MPRACYVLVVALMSLAATALAQEPEVPPTVDLDVYREPTDRSVERALQFLAERQVVEFDAAATQDDAARLDGAFRANRSGNTGVTSLCVLAFMAKGHTPGCGPYGETINRGVDYVLRQQHDNGLLVARHSEGRTHGHMYSHSISTLMLAEASGMVSVERQRRIDEALPAALALLLNAQQVEKAEIHRGGWRYQPDSKDADLSLTGWAVMALRAGKLNGAPVPDENIERAVAYIVRCFNEREGGFAYQPGQGATESLTGMAILCLELCGEHGHDTIEPAAKLLLDRLPQQFRTSHKDYYARYYGAQAMFQLGGEQWQSWAATMFPLILEAQQDDGSWSGGDGTVGQTYNTAMSVLALSVVYRQLPIYQREHVPVEMTP